jgi:glycosyltransferase involved in cell wall biosynthesis
MNRITAIVITHDEASNIEECLRSLAFCDERLVVDSFSQDDTVRRALPLAERVVRREFRDHAEQKNWALEQLDTEWALIVDADERVSEELATELRELADAGEADAYWLHRVNSFFGRWIRGSGWGRDRVLRFLRPGAGAYPEARLHEEIALQRGTRVGHCHSPLRHYSYEAWPSTFERLLRYSGAGAAERQRRGRGFSIARVVLAPSGRWIRQYLLQAGFRDGIHGYALCTWSAIGVFLRELKGYLGEASYGDGSGRAPTAPSRVEVVKGPEPGIRPEAIE